MWPGQPAGDDIFDDLHQDRDLGIAASLQVLGGAREHGHMPDAGPLAPAQNVLGVLGPVFVPQAGAS
jgi:hypothetical protein